MPKVVFNFKICDKSPACGGVEVCPTGALYYDDGIEFDESKCVGCGACVKSCPVMAIHLAKTKQEELKIQSEIDADARKSEDLFVDRYGADVIETQLSKSDGVSEAIKNTDGILAIELNNEELLRCLLNSIPTKELFAGYNVKHIKVFNPDDSLLQNLTMESNELPALVFYKDGKRLGAVSGYFENSDTEKSYLIKKVKEILQ